MGMVSPLNGKGSEEGAVPRPLKNFRTFLCENDVFGAFWHYFEYAYN